MTKNDIELQLLGITREFLLQLEAERAIQSIKLDASLDRELGIDSLGKVELLRRIEKAFNVRLSESAMAEAETLQDIALLIQQDNTIIETKHKISIPLTATLLDLSKINTLQEVIALYGTNEANRPHIYYQNEFGGEQIIRYGDLFREASKIAKGLQQRGIKPSETIAIMLPTGPGFFYAFFGVILSGAIPVPIYPPFRPDRIEEYTKREAKILHNAEVRILITFAQAETLSKILRTFIPSLKEVTTVKSLQVEIENPLLLFAEPNDGTLIQYTSGSTGDPKGVYLTHANMLANIRAIGAAAPIKSTDVTVSWLPLYHDMGLMTWLASLYFGIPVTIMSPMTFLTRPEKWLWAIHYHRATMSGGPNFAYELCANKINPKNIEGLDLSSWRFAFNGAESINPKTLESFSKRFAPYGFKPEMFAPVYGLAESTVALTFPKNIRPPRIDKIQRELFQLQGQALPAPANATKGILELVACGQAIPEHSIRIVNDAGIPVPDRTVGNLQFKGPSSMQGYFNNPTATQKIFHDGWWDTGDLAYIADEDVFITGRKKDIIIKAGRNIFPEEVEEIVSHTPNIRKGCVVAFGISDTTTGTEKLIVVAETKESSKEEQQKIRSNIIEQMSLELNLPPDAIVLVPTKTIPKTSSGKLQRSACKKLYLQGKLTQQKHSVKLQILKLTLIGVTKKIKQFSEYALKACYACYASLILILTFPFLYLSILLLSQKMGAIIIKYWARNYLRILGCPLKIYGKENITQNKKLLYVANHASYIDAIILIGVLPAGVIFTAKSELNTNIFLRKMLKKLNHITIDRMDFTKSLENKKLIHAATLQGQSIVIFPEGTFTYATGLRPFKLGAFSIAAETNTPICPVAISGSRNILRGESLLPRPGKVAVYIGEPIYPNGNEWSEVLRLRLVVREIIAKHCGEQVIDIITARPTLN